MQNNRPSNPRRSPLARLGLCLETSLGTDLYREEAINEDSTRLHPPTDDRIKFHHPHLHERQLQRRLIFLPATLLTEENL